MRMWKGTALRLTGPHWGETNTLKPMYNRFDRCVREALEIQKHGASPKQGGINQDDGLYVTTKFWIPFMHHLTKEEKWRKNKDRTNRQQQIDVNSGTSDSI